jgi:GAF domain-containing protein/ActR/RegA family two-component response regulator
VILALLARRLGVIVAVLAALWSAGGVLLFEDLGTRQAARTAETVAAVNTAVETARRGLVREARLLAQEPSLVEGAARGDWSALARAASSRLVALTVEHVADLLLVTDAAGTVLAQMPSSPRVELPELAPPSSPTTAIRILSGRAWLLGLAPIHAAAGAAVGVTVVGQRVDRLEQGLAASGARPTIVALAAGRAVGTSRPDVPATGWTKATNEGTVVFGGEPWTVRPIPGGLGLWVLVPEGASQAERAQLWLTLLGSFMLAAVGVLAAARFGGRTVAEDDPHRGQMSRLLTVARGLGGSADLVATAEQALEVVGRVARMNAGAVYRLDPGSGGLSVVAVRGGEVADPAVQAGERGPVSEALRAGRAIVTDFGRSSLVAGEPREAIPRAGRRTQLALPIPAGGVPWGVMTLVSSEARSFGPEDLRLFEAVAAQLGLAVSRGTLVGEARERGRRLETMSRLARTIAATPSLDAALQRVVEAGVDIFGEGPSRLCLWLTEDDAATPRLRAQSGAPAAVTEDDRVATGGDLVGVVTTTRAPLVVADLATDPRVGSDERLRAEGFTSFAGAPLLLGERLLGALTVATRERHTFGDDDVAVLQWLGAQAAVAIDTARRVEEETAHRIQLAALLEIGRKLATAESTEALLTASAEEAARLLDVDDTGFRLVEGEELVAVGPAGAADQTLLRPRVRMGEGFSGQVAREGRPLMVALDEVPGPMAEYRDSDRRLGYTHYLGVPLRAGHRVVGVLVSRARRPFTGWDVELAQAVADQAAVALEHAQLYRDARRQAEQMRALADVGRRLSTTLDPDAVAQGIADGVRSLLAVPSSAVYWVGGESDDLVAIAVGGDGGTPDQPPGLFPPGAAVVGLAVRGRRTLAWPDLLEDDVVTLAPDLRERLEHVEERSVLAVPLCVHDRVVGALAVTDRHGRVFDVEEVRLAEAFAEQAALTLENARLFALESARRTQIETRAEVEREFAAELNLDRLLRLVIGRARELFGAQGVIHLAAGEQVLVPGAGSEGTGLDREIPFGHGAIGACAAARQALLVNDYPTSIYALPELAALDLSRLLAQPLVLGDRLLGVISLWRTGDDASPFGGDDLAMLEHFATQAAVATQNAWLYEEAERRRQEAEELARLTRALTERLTVSAVGERIVESVLALLHVHAASLRLLESGGGLRLVAVRGAAASPFEPGHVMPAGQGIAGRAVAAGMPIWSRDALTDPAVTYSEPDRAELEATGQRAALAVPLIVKKTIIGALVMADGVARDFMEREVALAQAFADQAALALENARLQEEAEQGRREAEVLADLARSITTSHDLGPVLQGIAEGARELTAGDVARIALREPDGDRAVFRYWVGAGRPEDAPLELEPGRGIAGLVLASGRPARTGDETAEPDLDEHDRWTAELAVPIRIGERVEGVLDVQNRSLPAFTDRHEAILRQLAEHAAIAIKNAQLYAGVEARAAEARERLEETTALLAVGQVLSQAMPVEEMMRRVAREVARAVGADMVGAYGLDPSGVGLAPIAGYQVPEALRTWFRTQPLTLARLPGLADEWRAGRSVWSADPQHDPRFDLEGFRHLPPLSVLVAPTRVRGESVGALFLVWWGTGREFQPAEIRLVEGMAAQVGLALENAELDRQRELRLKETETLLDVNRTLASTHGVEPPFTELMGQITRAIGADSVGVWILDESGRWLSPWRGYRVPAGWFPALERVRLSVVEHAFYAEGVQTRRAVFAREVASDPRIPRFVSTAAPHRSQLFVPIQAKERLIGGFIAVWLREARDLTPRELALVEAIASQAGVAWDNARLFEQDRRQVEELSVLHALSRAVTGQLDRGTLLEALRHQVPRVLAAERLVVLLVEDKTGEVEVALRVDDGSPTEEPPPAPGPVGLASVVLATGQPLRSEDYARDCERRGSTRADADDPPIWLGVPLMAGDRVLGVLTLSRREGPFTDAEERLATNIADLAALALHSANLYEERTRAYGELAAAHDHLVRTEKLRALGEMASGVAHDFNNLLAAILGRAQLLLRHVEEPRLRQWLQVIERSALDGAQTVRRLQEFARERRDEPLAPVDLNEVARDALEITQSRWREESLRRGITIAVETDLPPLPRVPGDPAELREAMTNLILNAVDAMPTGGTLTITSAVVGDQVEVAVTDTGTGIPEEIRDKIFDPFFTTKGPQGTGLGLSMTYGIVVRHGARITVDSDEGRGSTFRMIFPLPSDVEPPPSTPAAAPPAAEALRCLVVDDEETVGFVIGDLLETLGHRALVLTDGDQAIERLRAEPFDVVFTDLAMPGVSGWQIAQVAKEVSPELPVFVVTGYGVELSAEERRTYGVEAIYSKPLKIEHLVDAVARVQRTRPGGDESEEL